MSSPFSPEVIAAVLHHMNDDHRDDNLLIGRAFGGTDVTAATMVTFDGDAGVWEIRRADAGAAPEELRVPWSGGAITERPEVRREIVALYDAACAVLGITPRPH